MCQQVLFAEPPPVNRAIAASSRLHTLKLDEVKIQWDAFQSLRRDLAAMIDRLGDAMASVNQMHAVFSITPTIVRRLAANGKVRKTGRRRKRYHVRDVLLAVLHSGAGRIRRPSSAAGYGHARTQAGVSVGGEPFPPASPFVVSR